MADLAKLEAAVRTLQDIEAIKKLKARYWRCVDKKLWKEMETCFARDAKADYGPGMVFEGMVAVVDFLKASTGQESMITAHGGHNAEIEITGENSATGIWALNDLVIIQPNTKMMGWGHYEDEYVREKGQWRIKTTRITRILEDWQMQKR